MKLFRTLTAVAFGAFLPYLLPAQSAYTVTERGPNYNVLQKTTLVNGTHRVEHYTELATGLNFTNAYGQLVPASEAISLLPGGGAAAKNGQHQVYFPGDPATSVSGYFADHPDISIPEAHTGSATLDASNEQQDEAGWSINSYVLPLYAGSFDYIVITYWTIPGSGITNSFEHTDTHCSVLDNSGDSSENKFGSQAFRQLNDIYYNTK